MPSRTHICNLALQEIGEPPITDIDDITTEANRCKLVFDDVVDEVCASKFWSKIKNRVELALLPDPPVYDFIFQFQLPADHLNILFINDSFPDSIRFSIEKKKLLIDRSSVFITYIQKQTNPEEWGQFLERAITLRLAAGIAYIFTGSLKIAEALEAKYNRYSRTSSTTDSNQGSRRLATATTLTRVR